MLSPNCPGLSHLMFADDTIFFTKAMTSNCQALRNILDSYCAASGHAINFDKSSVFFLANTPDPKKSAIATILQISYVSQPGVYLGLPTMWCNSKRSAMTFIREQIRGRIVKARYFKHSSFLKAKKGSRPSWIWNSLLAGRDSISNHSRWQVRNGKSIDVWTDRWVPNNSWGLIIPTDTSNRFIPLLVADVIDASGNWNITHLKPFLKGDDAKAIKSIPIGSENNRDVLIWPFSKSGVYSAKSGYRRIVKEQGVTGLLNLHRCT
ncbi:hypothetical protein ACLB2K_038427 [Fragaria x ananassa]